MSLETLIFVLAVGLFVYANLVRPWLERLRRRPAGPLRPGPGDDDAGAVDAAGAGGAPQRTGPADEAPRAPRRFHAPHDRRPGADPYGRGLPPATRASGGVGLPRAADLRRLAPGDLRRVIALTTVLGPCRALQDADRDPSRQD